MKQIHSKKESHKNRRGIAILWLIIWGSMFLTFFCVVLEIATLWQAHVEVKNALDAGAMAAVKEWGVSGSGSSTQIPRNVGIAYVEANPILGTSVTLNSNYTAATVANPNGNLSCSGDFVFGALDKITAPITFDRNAQGGCISGDVTITINKPLAGTGVTANEIEVIFEDGDPGLTIQSIEFTLPTTNANDGQRPYFDANVDPEVSQVPADFNGLNVANNGANWNCPNGVGDICFEFPPPEIGGLADRYQSVVINFAPGSFTSTGVPATTDFFHFGVSTNSMNPPALSGNNDGDAWGNHGVIAKITFYNTLTMKASTASASFVNTGGSDGISVATFSGGGGGFPAVVAQATVPVQGFCSSLFGVTFFNITAQSTAYYDCGTGRAYLVSAIIPACP